MASGRGILLVFLVMFLAVSFDETNLRERERMSKGVGGRKGGARNASQRKHTNLSLTPTIGILDGIDYLMSKQAV